MKIGLTIPLGQYKLSTRHFYRLEMKSLIKFGHDVILIPEPLLDSYKVQRLDIPFCIIYYGINPNKRNLTEEINSLSNCKFIASETDKASNMLKEWGITKPITKWIPPVDINIFQHSEPLGDNIICGSRLTAIKGIDKAIQATDGNIDVFGDSDNIEYIKYLKSLSDNTRFHGMLNPYELRDLFSKNWLYLYPSIIASNGRMDGIPTIIQEALAMGLQVIASPIGGITELKHIHFVESDPSKIKEKIMCVPRELNKEGIKYVRDNFSPEICVKSLLKDIKDYS